MPASLSEPFPTSVNLIKKLRAKDVSTAIASSIDGRRTTEGPVLPALDVVAIFERIPYPERFPPIGGFLTQSRVGAIVAALRYHYSAMSEQAGAPLASAEAEVAAVRDDPAARLALMDRLFQGPTGRAPRHLPFRRAALSFMRWQAHRGVLNPLDASPPGSLWWRAMNDRLLRDGGSAFEDVPRSAWNRLSAQSVEGLSERLLVTGEQPVAIGHGT